VNSLNTSDSELKYSSEEVDNDDGVGVDNRQDDLDQIDYDEISEKKMTNNIDFY